MITKLSYGKLKDKHSFLYDVKPQLQICINGQLLLCMLAERLSLIDGVTVIQTNTDGVTVHVPKTKVDEVMDTAKRWEKLTKLELERADYDKMVLYNVNNYLARYTNGKVKLKGACEIDPELHKNSSQRIVPIALMRYFMDGVPIADTIMNHMKGEDYGDIKNYGIYDFCHGRKVKWNQEYVIIKGVNETKIDQKVIRYYNTTERTTMMKKYNDGRVEAVNKGYRAKLFQDYIELSEKEYNIDYNYYINECYKITTLFDGGNPKIGYQLKLFD